jgi:hypothetical protein
MSPTLVAARRERRRNYRSLRAIGWTPTAARAWLETWGRRAALARACALLVNEPGGWTADGEYVAAGR